ncbi:MAG: DUF3280 domain-containing protein [Methylovirgula sp.]|jgi:hypothetical protein
MMLLRAAFVLLFLLPFAPAEAAAPKTIVFEFYFDNTSPEPTTDAETARIKKISDELRTMLAASKQYDVIPGTVKPFTSVPDFSQCTGDEVQQAQKAGAQYVACGWVQKVSNLILNLNLIIQDSKTGKAVRGGSVDIRGNTDESWDRGLKYLLDEHVFQNH